MIRSPSEVTFHRTPFFCPQSPFLFISQSKGCIDDLFARERGLTVLERLIPRKSQYPHCLVNQWGCCNTITVGSKLRSDLPKNGNSREMEGSQVSRTLL